MLHNADSSRQYYASASPLRLSTSVAKFSYVLPRCVFDRNIPIKMNSLTFKALALLSVSGFTGWLLMKGLSPSTEELKKKLPEGNPANYTQSQKDTQKLMDALRAAADNPQPIYKTWKKE